MFLSAKQLHYFVTVIRMGSIRKAAEKMGVSQPAVSGQIAMLEQMLEVKLLERTRQGTTPSPVGRSLLPYIQRLLQENREIVNLAKDAAQSPSGTHRLGVPPTLGPYLLPEILPEIHRQFPSLRIFVKEDTPVNLEQGLQEAEYDLIFTPLPLNVSRLNSTTLFAEPLYVVAAPDHPLAQKKSIQPDAFVGEHFLVVEERHRFFAHVQQVAKDFGFNLLRDYEGTSLDTLRQMIGVGMGVSFLPALYIRSEILPRQDVVILDLDFTLPKREIAIAWRQNSPENRLYKDIVRIISRTCREKLAESVDVI